MPTVQILLRNNRETIERALKSVSGLGRIVVGNLGSEDGSLEICASYGAEIFDFRRCSDLSAARNELSDDGLNFYLEAWETVARGADLIGETEDSARVCVISGGMVSKEIRIWNGKGRFKNPAYETIVNPTACYDPRIVVISGSAPDLRAERRAIVENWLESRPTSSEPYYYMACSCLSERKYKDFLHYAGKYLAMEGRQGADAILLNYYMAQIGLHTGRLEEASKHILFCIACCPTMAEFWCLLGDMFYRQNKFGKARSMYENATIIGRKRKNSDPYPVEISKYLDYPEKMMKNIDDISFDMIERIKKMEGEE